jgi:hypothetical protein
MIASFYSNCAVLTYEVKGERALVSESSKITELESDDPFEVLCPPTFICGSEVVYSGMKGKITVLGSKFAEVIFGSDLRTVKITDLSLPTKQNQTIIRCDGTMKERLNELSWRGRGKIVVEDKNSIMTFHVRLISTLPYPLTFDQIEINDRGFQDEPDYRSNAPSFSKAVSRNVASSPIQENNIDEITYSLEGPITLNSMMSIPVMNMKTKTTVKLMYSFLTNYSFVRVHGKYKGELYRGNYTVVVPRYNITQSCLVSANPQKSFTLDLVDKHGPYSVDITRNDYDNNGFFNSGTITNRSNDDIEINLVSPYYDDYVYEPKGELIAETGEIYWVIIVEKDTQVSYELSASRVVSSKYKK